MPPTAHWQRQDTTRTVNGLRLHVIEFSRAGDEAVTDPDQRTVLMVHGLNGQAANWKPIVDRLAVRGRMVCPDLRGHGESDWTRDGYWMRDFADDLQVVVDDLGLQHVDVVGHSLGARITMILAGRLGDRVRSLALSDCAPEISRQAAHDVAGRAGGLASKRGLRTEEEARQYLREVYPSWRDEFIDDQVSAIFRWNWADRLVRRADPELSWITGSAGLREVDHMWEMCRAVRCPTLVMRGRSSHILDRALADRLCAEIPDARLAEFDTGHYIPFEDPDGFADQYSRFLAAS